MFPAGHPQGPRCDAAESAGCRSWPDRPAPVAQSYLHTVRAKISHLLFERGRTGVKVHKASVAQSHPIPTDFRRRKVAPQHRSQRNFLYHIGQSTQPPHQRKHCAKHIQRQRSAAAPSAAAAVPLTESPVVPERHLLAANDPQTEADQSIASETLCAWQPARDPSRHESRRESESATVW
jgi:hypothetical protein